MNWPENDRYYNYHFLYTPSQQLEEIMIVSDLMACTCSKALHVDRKFFNNNIVMYVKKGSIHVEQYGKEHILHDGQGIMMRLNDPHIYYSDPDHPVHLLFFHFRSKTIDPLMDTLFQNNRLPVIFEDSSVRDGIYHCFDITRMHKPDFEFTLSAAIYRIVLNIASPALLPIRYYGNPEDAQFVDCVNRYMEDHIGDRVVIEDLSEQMRMSKFYFIKKFKHIFGMPPLQYALSLKISHSIEMMKKPSLSISEIAHTLGFFDVSHFSRTFRAQTGLTPSEYRETHF